MKRARFSDHSRRLLCAVALLAQLGVTGIAWATDDADLTGRFENVKRLIESSSGAERVDASGVAEAVARREEARALYVRANEAHAQGDPARAGELLGDASRAMFDAMRLASTQALLDVKRNRDFDERASSIEALTAAHTRIVTMSGLEKEAAAVADEMTALVAKGQSLREAGQLDEGRAVLDGAYNKLKVRIEQLRGGQTLVRTLKFDSKEEEYAYEVDRNETHKMLLEVLTQEKSSTPARTKMVNDFVDRATVLREKADGQAEGGDHEEAVKTLEQSTKEYIRAIRSSGVYIPG